MGGTWKWKLIVLGISKILGLDWDLQRGRNYKNFYVMLPYDCCKFQHTFIIQGESCLHFHASPGRMRKLWKATNFPMTSNKSIIQVHLWWRSWYNQPSSSPNSWIYQILSQHGCCWAFWVLKWRIFSLGKVVVVYLSSASMTNSCSGHRGRDLFHGGPEIIRTERTMFSAFITKFQNWAYRKFQDAWPSCYIHDSITKVSWVSTYIGF